MTCCGKSICSGCLHADALVVGDDKLCPFCRTPAPETDEMNIKRVMKRVEVGDAEAMYEVGSCYADGRYDFPQDEGKALELWRRAGELGYAEAFNNIGYAYDIGNCVERDEKKATHYYELAAIGGVVDVYLAQSWL